VLEFELGKLGQNSYHGSNAVFLPRGVREHIDNVLPSDSIMAAGPDGTLIDLQAGQPARLPPKKQMYKPTMKPIRSEPKQRRERR